MAQILLSFRKLRKPPKSSMSRKIPKLLLLLLLAAVQPRIQALEKLVF